MTVVTSLWASVQRDPVFMRRVNGWLTIFWIVMIPISLATGWVSSVVYVSALSLWALVSGHWSAWQAARVEVAQQNEAHRHEEEDIALEVVERIVRDTDIAATEGTGSSSALADEPPVAPPGWYQRQDSENWWSGTHWDIAKSRPSA